jgi:hypothetical protein
MSSIITGIIDFGSVALVAAIILLLLRKYSGKGKRGRTAASANDTARWATMADNEPDRLVRLWRLLSSNGKIGLAVAAAFLLAFAQFFTTRLGLSNFIPWWWVAVMAAVGIQVILYLGAWLVAERSADRAFLRRKRLELDAGLSEPEELSRAEAAVKSSGTWWIWIMFGTGLWVSVFFSFDALFDRVYLPEQQTLNNLKVARSSIGSMFGSMEKKLVEDRNDELKNLTNTKEWQAWQTNLLKILDTADNSKELLQNAWNTENNKIQMDLADARQRLQKQQELVVRTKSELETIGREPAAAQSAQAGNAATELKQAEDRRDEIQRGVSDLERERDDVRAKLDPEAKAGGLDAQGKRRPAGQGPVWRELKAKFDAIEAELGVRRRSLEEMKRRVENLKRDSVAAAANRGIKETELQKAESEIDDLTLKVKNAESRRRSFAGEGEKTFGSLSGVSDQVLGLRRALANFTGTGSSDAFNTVRNGCNSLLEILRQQEKTKEYLGQASCDATAVAPRIAKLAGFETAMAKYEEVCRVDDSFNALTAVKGMVDRARVCAGLSSLPFSRINAERSEIDKVEQENSPNTSHFERAIATLSRGDKLAWLALAIAFSIDFLVLVAAMLGARAADHVAPQSVLDDISLAHYIDLRIYDTDPTYIRNQKTILSLSQTDFESASDGSEARSRSVIDLGDVPIDLRGAIQPLLAMYVSMGMAGLDTNRSGVYRLSGPLVSKLVREIGAYEKRQDRHRSDSSPGPSGESDFGRGSSSNDNINDPMEPRSFADRRRQQRDTDDPSWSQFRRKKP